MKKWFLIVCVLSSFFVMPLQAQQGSSSGNNGQYNMSVITLKGGLIKIPGQPDTPYLYNATSQYGGNNVNNAIVEMSGAVTPHWKWN
jgi:hypothetical protein